MLAGQRAGALASAGQDDLDRLGSILDYGFWEQVDDEHTAIRLATSWATTDEDVDALLDALSACGMV